MSPFRIDPRERALFKNQKLLDDLENAIAGVLAPFNVSPAMFPPIAVALGMLYAVTGEPCDVDALPDDLRERGADQLRQLSDSFQDAAEMFDCEILPPDLRKH